MDIEKRDQLLSDRRDFDGLTTDLIRVMYMQDDLVYKYGQITVEEAKKNIKELKKSIQYYKNLIKITEEQLSNVVGRSILFNH